MPVAERIPAARGLLPARPVAPVPNKRSESPQAASASLVEYGARRYLVVIGVMLATLLQTVDSPIVNVALPTIQGNLGATVRPGHVGR